MTRRAPSLQLPPTTILRSITRKPLKIFARYHNHSIAEMAALAELFMPLKLVPNQLEGLVDLVRGPLE
ncbi:hypothetical protein, partial [Pseudomonas syringae group genomosp. 7]|uniref:hypothetical protein n=1 Tax=Pseudomonas syringae group genomosp. 7 TaxID=251699 RepID=UPI00376FAA38